MSTLLFVGGGSVGHIAPGIAIYEAFTEKNPQTNGHFICSPRPDDAAYLEANNLPYTILNAPRLSLSFPLTFLKAVKESNAILRAIKPDLIVSKGGYVSVPLCFAAHTRGIPIVLHESDAISGYANRIVSRWADAICHGSGFRTKHPRHHVTGNPVRRMMTEGSEQEAKRITGLTGEKPVLLVMGGSQGAKDINTAIHRQLDILLKHVDIIHITGRGKEIAEGKPGYFVTAFATDALPHFYALANIAISRAGAGSIAELEANGIPSILVPLRGVGHDHQYSNAIAAATSPTFFHIEQENLLNTLTSQIENLLNMPSAATKSSQENDAATRIAAIMTQVLDSQSQAK